MPPGIGYPPQQPMQGQPQQPGGLFQDVSQIPPQLQQQLYRQFLGEQLGFLPPSPPGGGGGVFNFQPSQDFRQPQMQQPQPAQQPKQKPQVQQPQQQPQQPQVSQPMQPAPQPIVPAIPQIQPPMPIDQGYMWSGAVPPGTGGVLPNPLGAGGAISANSGVNVPSLNSLLFGG